MGRTGLACLSLWTLTWVGPAFAEAEVLSVSIEPGSLPNGLQTLQRQTGIELLFDHALVSGLQSPAVQGDLTPEAALRELVADTNLTVRRAASGAWIVEHPDAAPLARPDAVVPEILIVGQRTQNADLRRFENDVQPYTVATRAEILRAHRDNIDQFFTSRVTSNTQVIPAGLSQTGDTASLINLRGLGYQGTLVLIDGRRMPSIPVPNAEFRQSDLNAIPLHAIKRIEILTGAAGGIHGFGALGGVVNVVLDRDSRGIDLHVTEGISSRGDARQQGVEARFGRTSSDGATDLMLFAARSQFDTVLAGERDYAVRDRRRTWELTPQFYWSQYSHGNSVNVRSLFGLDPVTGELVVDPNLTLKPEFGGATLPSNQTFLPTGFSGTPAALATSLTQHAGQQDFSLTSEEANADLGSNPRSDALLASLRHKFRGGLEAYGDAVVLRSRGESYEDSPLSSGQALMSPESPANPFTDFIQVFFPIEQQALRVSKLIESTRYTAGLVADLPFHWRATAEIGLGGFRRESAVSIDFPDQSTSLLALFGDATDLDTNPFGNWTAFQDAIEGSSRRTSSERFHTRFRDQSLRLAGPVFGRVSRPSTLTLLAEHRTESVPSYTEVVTTESDTTTTVETAIASYSSAATSFYAELRAPVFAREAPTLLLRGLELQLAVRRDDLESDFSRFATDPDSERIQAQFIGTAYTAGAKISPTPWLMLRGSYATGEQPPSLHMLIEQPEFTSTIGATDPKRGGTRLGTDGAYVRRSGGNADLKAARASTVFIGAVVTPSGEDGPRLAVDFSRIRRTRDVASFLEQTIIDHEDDWPHLVTRAPLTDADQANGYAAGRVVMVDTRITNAASMEVDSLDMRADWPLACLGGRLQLYADATYHMRNVQREPFQDDLQWAGYREGPLKWRANGGFDWSTDRLTIGANLQYFGSSLIFHPVLRVDDLDMQLQGSRRIPSQSYLDLHGTWRLPVRNFGPLEDLNVDLGIVNVLDKVPPRESSLLTGGPGYSRYGDPRQRRFELGLSGHF